MLLVIIHIVNWFIRALIKELDKHLNNSTEKSLIRSSFRKVRSLLLTCIYNLVIDFIRDLT